MDLDLDALRAAAEKATPGPWVMTPGSEIDPASVRVEAEDWKGGVKRAYATAPRLSPAKQQQVDEVAERLITTVAEACRLSRSDAAALIVAELLFAEADDAAYQREAARRGVLAL